MRPAAMELSMIVEMTSCTPAARLERAGDRGPQGAAEDAGDHRDDGDEEAGGLTDRVGGRRGADRARHQLALGTDVEQADAQRDDDRESAEDERHHLLEGGLQTVRRAEGVGEQALVRVRRVDALGPDQDRTDGESGDDGHDGHDDGLLAHEQTEDARRRRRRSSLGHHGRRCGLRGDGALHGGAVRRLISGIGHLGPLDSLSGPGSCASPVVRRTTASSGRPWWSTRSTSSWRDSSADRIRPRKEAGSGLVARGERRRPRAS